MLAGAVRECLPASAELTELAHCNTGVVSLKPTWPMHPQAVGSKGEDLGVGFHIANIAHPIQGADPLYPELCQLVQAAQDLLSQHCLLPALVQAQLMQTLQGHTTGLALALYSSPLAVLL